MRSSMSIRGLSVSVLIALLSLFAGGESIFAGDPVETHGGYAASISESPNLRLDSYIVYEDGSGSYPTIQSAINAAQDGDSVLLADGTFTGGGNRGIHYNGKAITVRSLNNDPVNCIIDCQGQDRAFWFDGGEGRDSYLKYVTIRNGHVNSDGGGVLIGKAGFPPITEDEPAHPSIIGCILENNTVSTFVNTVRGGGIAGIVGSSPRIEDCIFTGNTTGSMGVGQGGGLYLYGGVIPYNPEIIGCSFLNNDARTIGGAVFLEGTDSEIDNCLFSENTASMGGALYAYSAQMTVEYCTFTRNSSSTSGGAVYIYGDTPFAPDFINCTFYSNSSYTGSAFMFHTNGNANIVRTIVSDGTGGVAFDRYLADPVTLSCCDVYGNEGGPGFVSGLIGASNNFSAFPAYCHPSNDDFTLRDISPCAPGNSPCGQQVGAWGVGCSGPITHQVCPDGTGDFLTIQAGIDASQNGDTVELCDAIYAGAGNENMDYEGRAITVRSASGHPENCIIDCGGTKQGFYFHNNEDRTSMLEGVTIRNGYHVHNGGAVACSAAAPSFINVWFEECDSYEGGAVMVNGASNPYFSGCTFQGNTADNGAGLAFGGGSTGLVERCEFVSNTAAIDAGGLWSVFGSPIVRDCHFEANQALSGGAIQTQGNLDPQITKCMFYGNNAEYGGAIAAFYFFSTIDSCTFVDNRADGDNGWGGGFYLGNDAEATLENCTFYANSVGGPNKCGAGAFVDWDSRLFIQNTIIAYSTEGEAVCCNVNCTATLECCDVYGNAGGDYTACIATQNGISGNINLPPLFCNAPNGDYTLSAGSPCAPFSPPNPECDLIGAWPIGCGGLLNYADHNVGNCLLTMTDQGILGFMDETQAEGSGFIYPITGSNHLYTGGLWVSDGEYVANRDYDSDPAREWVVSTAPDGHVVSVAGVDPDQMIHAGYTDAGAVSPHGLYVRQESWAYANAPDDDYVIIRTFIHNTSGSTMDEMYASLFLDFDLGDGTDDTGGIDRARSLVYMTDTSGEYVGLRLLDADQSPDRRANLTLIHNPTYVWPQSYLLDADKMGFLRGTNRSYILEDGSTPDDYSVLVSAGPFSLAPGDSNEVTFVVLGGSSLADLQANSDQAQIQFIGDAAGTPDQENPALLTTCLLPNQPNPFNPKTMVRFQLSSPGQVKLAIYNVGGRRIRSLAQGAFGGGPHAIIWDGRDDSGQPVASGVYFSRFESGNHRESRRMMLVR
ncbi:MAG: hypothetical protein KJ927_17765 [Candidatus Eisenbacteria bacterium]|nr:hypothetical protein [Candidatus Eisenbacteria bacterium]